MSEPVKRGRRDRACDACRRRKTKCDGPWMAGGVCTNCIQSRKSCTYIEESKPRGPPKAYVSGLEDKLEALEALLQQVRPDSDFSDELGPPVTRGSWKDEPGPSTASSFTPAVPLPPMLISFNSEHHEPPIPTFVTPSPRTTHLFRPQPRSKRHPPNFHAYRDANPVSDDESTDGSASTSSDTEEVVVTSLAGRTRVTLLASENDDTLNDNNIRFHGRSSTAGLVEATRIFKHMHLKETLNQMPQGTSPTSPDNEIVAQTRRPQFWAKPDWEFKSEGTRLDSPEIHQIFLGYLPPPDLADTLIDLYFRHVNLLFPLLHRPTFDRQWREQLHRRNIWFACLCFSIFAVASRWSDDERVLADTCARGECGELDWRKAGRLYFELAVEIHQAKWGTFHSAGLFEVQTFTLLSMYLRGTHRFPAAWLVASVGIRRAQDVGAHRKRAYHTETTTDNELWKRAFWHLVVFDRIVSSSLGRPCSVVEEDFDIDLLIEVDDEYWEGRDGRQPFTQPPGVPSSISSFNQFVKLTRVIAFTTRTLYAVNKSKVYRGLAQVDRDSVVKQLIPAMEGWMSSLPDHLRWKERMDNPKFSDQAANLATIFHVVQILIYRPLIVPTSLHPTSKAPHLDLASPLSIISDPAVDMCLQAARSCARIVEVQLRQGLANYFVPGIINASYISAGMLLWHAWNLKVREGMLAKTGGLDIDIKPPLAQRIEANLADAKVFLAALEEVRPRWDAVDLLLEELQSSLRGLESRVATDEDSISETHNPIQSCWMGPDHSQTDHHQPYSVALPPSTQQPPPRPSLYASKFSHSVSDLRSGSASKPSLNVRLHDNEKGGQRVPQSAGAALHPLHSFPLAQAAPHSGSTRHTPHPPSHPPHPSSHGRTRASSMATVPMAFTSDERGMPFISSVMRRTSVPNMAAAARSGQPLAALEQVVRYDDVNIHFDMDTHSSSSQYLQDPYQRQASSLKYGTYQLVPQGGPDKVGLRMDASSWDRPAGVPGQWTGSPASSPVSPCTHYNHSTSSLNVEQGPVPIQNPFNPAHL